VETTPRLLRSAFQVSKRARLRPVHTHGAAGQTRTNWGASAVAAQAEIARF